MCGLTPPPFAQSQRLAAQHAFQRQASEAMLAYTMAGLDVVGVKWDGQRRKFLPIIESETRVPRVKRRASNSDAPGQSDGQQGRDR